MVTTYNMDPGMSYHNKGCDVYIVQLNINIRMGTIKILYLLIGIQLHQYHISLNKILYTGVVQIVLQSIAILLEFCNTYRNTLRFCNKYCKNFKVLQ